VSKQLARGYPLPSRILAWSGREHRTSGPECQRENHYATEPREVIGSQCILRAIDGLALSIDRATMLDDRSFAQPLSNRAVLSADGGASAFALTTDSAALSIGNNNAYLCSSACSAAVLD